MKIERRNFPVSELRMTTTENEAPMMTGRAAVFNSYSDNLRAMTSRGEKIVFREIIMPGAFRSALKKSDPRALFNHDPNLILGRSSSGTLRLKEDDQGLPFEIDPPDTTYAKDLQVSMGRGDVRECSFGFNVKDGGDKWAMVDGILTRTILEDGIEELLDVSPVTYPAYPETDCAVRSIDKATEIITPVFDDTEHRRMLLDLEALAGPAEERVNMGWCGESTVGACSTCNLSGCLCPDCVNSACCNMQTAANGGACTKCMQPGCQCLTCPNTDQAKLMKMYSM